MLAPVIGGLIVLAAFVAAQRAGGRRKREVLLPPVILAARPVLSGLLSGADRTGVFSLGMGLTAPAQMLAVMTFTPDEHKNMASSALNSARQTGGVTGVALLGALSAAHPATGLPVAMLLAVAACLTTAINALRHIPASGPQAR